MKPDCLTTIGCLLSVITLKHEKTIGSVLTTLEQIQLEQEQTLQEQVDLIHRIPERYWVNVLFELSTVLEKYYVETKGDLSALQTGTIALGQLLLRIRQEKKWGRDERTLEEVHEKWIHRIVKQAYKGRKQLVFAQLFDLELQISRLAYLADIDENDQSREVKYKEGRFEVVTTKEDLLTIEQKTSAKYHFEINFYLRLGEEVATHYIRQKGIVLRGKNEEDANASFSIMTWQFATRAYLEHYGIEEEFTHKKKTYKREILVEILAFFLSYYQSRYGITFANNINKGLATLPAVMQSMKDLARVTDQLIGPVVLLAQDDLFARLEVVLERYSTRCIRHHLTFFSTSIPNLKEAINLHHRPLLRQDDRVAIFLRPLMGQNTWIPLVQRLVGQGNDDQEQERTTRATQRLGEMLRAQGFTVIIEKKILKPNGDLLTDIDLGAFKDDHLFLFELKMTAPKSQALEYKRHLENKLKTRGKKQLQKSLDYMHHHWLQFRHDFATELPWGKVEKHLILLSPSFEWDRHPKLHPATKISMFELERYLKNDALFMFDDDKAEQVPELQSGFYPKGEYLSGSRLWELTEGDALWRFIDNA